MERQVRGDVLAENVRRCFGIRPLDLYFYVQPSRTEDGGIDHVLAVGGANDDHVVQTLHAVDFAEQLRHDGGFDVG